MSLPTTREEYFRLVDEQIERDRDSLGRMDPKTAIALNSYSCAEHYAGFCMPYELQELPEEQCCFGREVFWGDPENGVPYLPESWIYHWNPQLGHRLSAIVNVGRARGLVHHVRQELEKEDTELNRRRLEEAEKALRASEAGETSQGFGREKS